MIGALPLRLAAGLKSTSKQGWLCRYNHGTWRAGGSRGVRGRRGRA